MSTISIKTNNQPREILSGFDLSEKELEEFDYIEDEDEKLYSPRFVKYKNWVYDLGDTMRFSCSDYRPEEFKPYDGYHSDSFFSGVLFKFTEDGEGVICATYFS